MIPHIPDKASKWISENRHYLSKYEMWYGTIFASFQDAEPNMRECLTDIHYQVFDAGWPMPTSSTTNQESKHHRLSWLRGNEWVSVAVDQNCNVIWIQGIYDQLEWRSYEEVLNAHHL